MDISSVMTQILKANVEGNTANVEDKTKRDQIKSDKNERVGFKILMLMEEAKEMHQKCSV